MFCVEVVKLDMAEYELLNAKSALHGQALLQSQLQGLFGFYLCLPSL